MRRGRARQGKLKTIAKKPESIVEKLDRVIRRESWLELRNKIEEKALAAMGGREGRWRALCDVLSWMDTIDGLGGRAKMKARIAEKEDVA